MSTQEKDTYTLGSPRKEEHPVAKNDRKLIKTGGKLEEFSSSTVLWYYMREKHSLSIEQLLQLRQATTPAVIQGRPGTLVRILTQASCYTKGVSIKDFDSLNEHPNLILYDGYYYKNGKQEEIFIEKRTGNGLSLLERELQEGGITGVGMIAETRGSGKLMGGFRKFLKLG